MVPERDARLFLVGLMGSGKSSVAAELRARLGWPVVDNDAALAAGTGRRVAELSAWGPDALHALEGLQLDLAAAAPAPLLVTVAASVAEDRSRQQLMVRQGRVVYLRAAPAVLAARIVGTPRPWLDGDLMARLDGMHRARDPALTGLADLVCETGHRRVGQVADEILAHLALPPPTSRP